MGLAIDVGAHVEHDGGGVGGGGKDHGQRRTIDAGNDSQDHFGGDHGGAGVAGGDKAVGRAVFDQTEADAHGRVALGLDRLRGLFVHADKLGGMHDLDGQAGSFGVKRQFGAHHVLLPDQEDPDVTLPCG